MKSSPTPSLALGSTLKAGRKQAGLTLAQLGTEMGLANGNFIGMVERGERCPSDEGLVQMGRLLSLDPRELLALKYRDSHPAAFEVLLSPPQPRYPRLRRMLLASCADPEQIAAELERAAYGLMEQLIFRILLQRILLPALRADRYAPRRLREKMAAHRELREGQHLPPDIFEQEAQTFIPWVRGELPMLSWELNPHSMMLRLQSGKRDQEAEELSLLGPSAASSKAAGSHADQAGLSEILALRGLEADEVAEVLDLIEWKKARRKRVRTDAD